MTKKNILKTSFIAALIVIIFGYISNYLSTSQSRRCTIDEITKKEKSNLQILVDASDVLTRDACHGLDIGLFVFDSTLTAPISVGKRKINHGDLCIRTLECRSFLPYITEVEYTKYRIGHIDGEKGNFYVWTFFGATVGVGSSYKLPLVYKHDEELQ